MTPGQSILTAAAATSDDDFAAFEEMLAGLKFR